MKFCRCNYGLVLLFAFIIINPALNAVEPDNNYVPILCYHRVTPKIKNIYDLTPDMLEKQLQFFKENGYHPITARQYIKSQMHPGLLPVNPVILTFDDGNKVHYQYVFPLLKQYGFQATFFVYPATIAEKSNYSITWDELSEMLNSGMDIESHTFTHPFLTSVKTRPDDSNYLKWLEHEIKDSKELLEQKLRTKIDLLAYPYGWYNCVIETKAIEAGYQGIFTVNWGTNLKDQNPWRLKRRPISNNFSLVEMKRYLTSKPLLLEILSPDDAAIVNEKPEIRFRLLNPKLHWVDIVIDAYKGSLTPDQQGIFTFTQFKLPYSGYYMVIVSGYDENDQLYINSWGFDYQKPAGEEGKPTSGAIITDK